MEIIEPKVEIYREPDHLRKIETIARVCTGTEKKVGANPDFLKKLLERGHGTPFEHVRVKVEKLPVPFCDLPPEERLLKSIFGEEMSGDTYGQSYRRIKDREKVLNPKTGRKVYKEFTAVNGRDFLAMGGKLDSLKKLPEADDYMTVKFTVDIGVARELIRHRQMSFMERSTRYVNFKDGIEFILPDLFKFANSKVYGPCMTWRNGCAEAERAYRAMIADGCKPQDARTVLPLSTATVLYMTGMYTQWEDVLDLRLAPGAHPQMRYIMRKLTGLPDFPKDKIKIQEECLDGADLQGAKGLPKKLDNKE